MQKFHYSWIICISCTLLVICTNGFPSNVFPIYLPYLQEVGFSGTQTSAFISVRSLFSVVGMLLVKKYYHFFSLRQGTAFACLAISISFFFYSLSYNFGVYVLASAISGFAYGVGGTIPASILLHYWFHTKQGLALGICAAGTGLCTVVFPPLIAYVVKTFSLSASFAIQVILSFLVACFIWIFMRDAPKDTEISPLGNLRPAEKVRDTTKSFSICDPNSSKKVGTIFLPSFLLGGIATSICGHNSIFFFLQGYSPPFIALGISLFGIALIIGKFIFGILSDNIGSYYTTLSFLLVLFIGTSLACISDGHHLVLLFGSLSLMGLGFPPASIGLSEWALDFSSIYDYESILQALQIAYAVGSMSLSLFPGIIYDYSGSYLYAYISFSLSTILIFFGVIIAYRLNGIFVRPKK